MVTWEQLRNVRQRLEANGRIIGEVNQLLKGGGDIDFGAIKRHLDRQEADLLALDAMLAEAAEEINAKLGKGAADVK